jgi:hypothetical protein
MTENHHWIRVTTTPASDPEDDLPTVDQVVFTCTAPPDASCRTYPDCDCETFSGEDQDEAGHPFKPGQPCWLTDWFDNDGACFDGEGGNDYNGEPPAIDHEGPIETHFEGDYVSWTWANTAAQPSLPGTRGDR